MDPQQRIHELIQKYFDQGATEAERSELQQQLHDSAAREAFVAAARLHAGLEELLAGTTRPGPAAVPRRSSRLARVLGATAAGLLLAAGGLAWWVGQNFPGGSPSASLTSARVQRSTHATDGALPPAEDMPPEAVLTMFGIMSGTAVK